MHPRFQPSLRRFAARLTRLVTASAVLLAVAAPVRAQEEIRAADNAVSLELGATDIDYGETFNGATLDTEKGWVPTATLGAGLLASDRAAGLLRNLYLHADLTGSIGQTDYNGAICNLSGTCLPYNGSTNDWFYAVSLQAGRGLPFGENMMLIPYVQLDYRYWDRQLSGTQTETYTNWAALGGLMGQISLAPRWVFSLSGALGATFGANMNDGIADYALGSALIYQTKAKLGLRLTERLELTGTVGYTHFDFGESPVVVEPTNAFCSSGCFEPHSHTDEVSLMSGVAYHF